MAPPGHDGTDDASDEDDDSEDEHVPWYMRGMDPRFVGNGAASSSTLENRLTDLEQPDEDATDASDAEEDE